MHRCIQKEMLPLKDWIPDYRFIKFKSRGWTIKESNNMQPVCYKNQFTISFPKNVEKIKEINEVFYQKMVV